jgi:UDP-glucose 4-epimerase
MNILITGGLGHVGSFLLDNFQIKKKINFFIIDNLLTERYCTLFNLKKKINCEFFKLDVSKDDISKIVKKSDLILHLAAITNAEGSFKIKDKVFKNNFQSTKKIADLCAKFNKPIILFSSTSVYGPIKRFEFIDENVPYNQLKPQSPYAECKIKEEKYLMSLKNKKFKFVILRLGTIFGTSPGMRFHTAVNKFCWQAANNQEISVWENAYNKYRPYLDLKDLSRFLQFLIHKKKYENQIINLVTENFTVEQVLKNIKKIRKIKIRYVKSKILNQDSYKVKSLYLIKNNFLMKGKIFNSIKKTISILT